MSNKYKVIYDILKPKVGPDCARLISYDVLCDDQLKEIKSIILLAPRVILKDSYFRQLLNATELNCYRDEKYIFRPCDCFKIYMGHSYIREMGELVEFNLNLNPKVLI
jgi:hypothetical protein